MLSHPGSLQYLRLPTLAGLQHQGDSYEGTKKNHKAQEERRDWVLAGDAQASQSRELGACPPPRCIGSTAASSPCMRLALIPLLQTATRPCTAHATCPAPQRPCAAPGRTCAGHPSLPAPSPSHSHHSLSFLMPLSRHLRRRQAWHCRRVFRVISQAPFRKGHLSRALRFTALLWENESPRLGGCFRAAPFPLPRSLQPAGIAFGFHGRGAGMVSSLGSRDEGSKKGGPLCQLPGRSR